MTARPQISDQDTEGCKIVTFFLVFLSSTAALGDGGAAAGVGVGLGAGAAVVVGGAATGAGHGVALEGAVADVGRGGEDAAACLRSEVELLPGEAFRDRAAAAGEGGDPAERQLGPRLPGGSLVKDDEGDQKADAFHQLRHLLVGKEKCGLFPHSHSEGMANLKRLGDGWDMTMPEMKQVAVAVGTGNSNDGAVTGVRVGLSSDSTVVIRRS
ncbi:hypothetical protein MUK42_18939 [Musa troglodytarum]|uniref:Uncharacterized protein n=1 Tax=Musa troglodytarum TaxID=320322 RepID=A0A9E7EZ79_9LILI|nr:hypothetical protein MUK42_18939 [Musa troglodytarum]